MIQNKKLPKIPVRDTLVWLSRTSLPEVLLAAALVLSKYQKNIDFSYPSEVILPIVLLGLAASAVYYMLRFMLGRVTGGHIAALPVVYVLYSFGYIYGSYSHFVRALLPGRLETGFTVGLLLMLFIMALALGLGWGLTKLSDHHLVRGFQLPKVLLFLVSFVFVVQCAQVGWQIVRFMPELSYQYKPAVMPQQTSTPQVKPDVYYLVFDRYGNTPTLKDSFAFDNSQMMSFLDGQGFVTRTDGMANYPFTMSSISSTLAMQYHTQFKQFGDNSFQTGFPYRSVLNDPPIANVLRKDGYQYTQVSSWWDFTRVGIHAENEPTKAFRLDILGLHFYLSDLQRDIISKSFLGVLFNKGITLGSTPIFKYSLSLNPRENFEWQMSALKQVASRADKSKPQFTFAHVLVPHDPYIFTADGSSPSYSPDRNDDGADETIKYTNQLVYLNSRIQDLVSTIRQKSPDAVVVIQADEGPYPKQFRFSLSQGHYYDPIDLSPADAKLKFGVLASYYMPGVDRQTVEQNIQASVNPLRFVLAQYLKYPLPMLPDCQFAAGDKFQVFNYQLMNEKLGKPADPACASL